MKDGNLKIFGLMMVRNEADILRVNLLYHFAQGVDRFLIVDNGSSDDTTLILEQLSQQLPLAWETYEGPYHQSKITTVLAYEAYLQGADWVIPIDADEFWHAPEGSLRDVLSDSSADVLRAEVVNFVQRREQLEKSTDALLHMTMRAPEPAGPLEQIRELAESQQASYVQLLYPPKCVSRASPAIEIGLGNHSVRGLGAQEDTARLLCLHAALRSRSVLKTLSDQGRRAEEAGNRLIWNWLRWQRLAAEGGLQAEWRANSYQEGCLDVYGVRHPLVEDLRLRDAVAPWIAGTCSADSAGEHVDRSRPTTNIDLKLEKRERAAQFLGQTLQLMENTTGWFTSDEGRLLIAGTILALIQGQQGAVVELGSFLGRSTVVLGCVMQEICEQEKMYAIDPHEGELTTPGDGIEKQEPTYERFLENIRRAGLEQVVKPIRRRSFEVQWDRPISFLLIDTLHDYENVSRDFRHFESWVAPGGYVAFHDYGDTYPGVKRLVDEVVRSGSYQIIAKVDILILLRKLQPPDIPEESPMTRSNEEADRDRLERQTKGVAILQEVLRREVETRNEQVGERDQVIRGLQAELHDKVGERDRIIRALQEELHAKVRERDEIIRQLQRQAGAAETS